MIKNICFLLVPSEVGLRYPNQTYMLPISIGVLSGYLRPRGIGTGMYDLNKQLYDGFKKPEERSRLEVLFDVQAVFEYLDGGISQEIDDIMKKMLEGINLDEYDSFGISLGADFSFLQMHTGFLLAKYLQKTLGKTVIIGGNNISFLFIFKDVFGRLWTAITEQFHIIKGPGEQAILQLIEGVNAGKSKEELQKIAGMVCLKDGEIVANPEFKPEVIMPDWEGLDTSRYEKYMLDDREQVKTDNMVCFYKWPDISDDNLGQMVSNYNKLKGKNIHQRLMIPYIFNYNCPYNCAFCTQSDYDRGSVIGAEPEVVLEHIKAMIDKYHTNYFYFLNNSFNFSGRFVDEFCRKVIDEGVKFYWSDCGRFNNLTFERLKLMKEAGCVKLIFGFETGSKKMLELIDKKLDLEKAEEVLKWCHELGIWADLEVIIGLPQEFDEDFEETCSFLRKNEKYINYFWVNEYFVVPNSLIGRNPEKYGVELIRDFSPYENMAERNLRYFKKDELPSSRNAKLYGFNEIGGRQYNKILQDNRRKLIEINKLQRREFSEAIRFYKMLLEGARVK